MPSEILPFQLTPIFKERVWGRKSLLPFFPDAKASDTSLIGEAWFTHNENLTSLGFSLGQLLSENPEILGSGADPNNPNMCPLLVKFIFTTERLSVQVHPDDDYARTHHKSLGKTEAWYVIAAEPGAEVAAGLKHPLTGEAFRRAIETGHIEQLLAWHEVKPGDTVLVPAGTIHAIGAGVVICEVQENSDITYRLWDYGRARELHVKHGTAVSRLEPYRFHPTFTALSQGRDALTSSQYFRMERLRPQRSFDIPTNVPHYLLMACTRGEDSGKFWFVPANSVKLTVEAPASEWILAYKADHPLTNLKID